MTNANPRNLPPHVPHDLVRPLDVYADPRLLDAPYELFRDMAQTYPPVFWTESNGGHWVIVGREAVQQALSNFEIFGSEFGGIPNEPSQANMFYPMQLDPPRHTPMRKMLTPMFSPKAIWKLEDEVRDLCRQLISAVKDKGECEFVEAIALPLPVLIFMRRMSMPESRYKEFSSWVHGLVTGSTAEIRAESFVKVVTFLRTAVMERQPNAEGDWIETVLASQIDGRPIDRETEAWPIANMLFLGGLDTVKNMLSHFMRTLAARPDLQARLASDPAIAKDAVEELFRYMGGSNPPRMVRKDTDFMGVAMRAGDLAVAYTPTTPPADEIADSSNINFDRKEKWHFAFGAGPHLCIGATLARLEMRVLLEEWFAAIPECSLKPGSKVRYAAGFVNAVDELWLSWPTSAS